MGLINALIQSGFLALTSYFPLDKIVLYSTGQGISGIIMSLLVLFVLFYVNTGDSDNDYKYGALIFFGISVLILFVVLCALLYLFNSDYGKEYLPSSAYVKRALSNSDSETQIDNPNIDENQTIKINREKDKAKVNRNKYWFFELMNSLRDALFLIWYNFFITFSVYPSVYIGQSLFDTGKYKTNIIINQDIC